MFCKASKIASLSLALSLFGAAGAAVAADVLVTESNGAAARTYPRGERLSDTATIQLGRGDRVVVLGAGGTRTFRGPGTFSVSGERQMASGVSASAGGQIARTGVSRRPEGEAGDESPIWVADIRQSGPVCVLQDKPLSLYRAEAGAAANVTIRGADGQSVDISFAEGQETAAWPASLSAPAEYQLSAPGMLQPSEIRLVPLAVDPEDSVSVAEALMSAECSSQFEAFIQKVESDAAAASVES